MRQLPSRLPVSIWRRAALCRERHDLTWACQFGEGTSERTIPFVGGVLVDQCGTRAGVPESRHELGGRGPGGRRPCRSGVAQVMQVELGASG